jgi:geranylgeranyl reductase
MVSKRIQKKEADVVIVGSGPAGIIAARELARRGADVAVLERHATPGKKACAGGLTSKAWLLAGVDPKRSSSRAERFSRVLVHTKLGSVPVTSDGSSPMLITFDRKQWIERRLEELRDLGVRIYLGQRLRGIDGKAALTSSGPLGFGVLIGADGAASRVRRLIGLGTRLALKTLQMRVTRNALRHTDVDPDLPHVWFNPSRFGSGYAWAFPFGDEVRVGCGISNQVDERVHLRTEFPRWLGSLGIDPSKFRLEAGSINCDYQGHRFDNVYLVGDAAGLASPLTGEGIAQALVSGEEVAKEICDSAYRSPQIPLLAVQHRRTHDILTLPGVAWLYQAAPLLLKIPYTRAAVVQKYML